MPELTLSELYIYPIKSAAGISVDAAELTKRGLKYDRRWMVVDRQGTFMTQRKHPQMALIAVGLGDGLSIEAPAMPALRVPLVCDGGDRLRVDVWGDGCEAVSCGAEAQQWFTQFMGTDCQLVYMPDNSVRPTDHGKLGSENLVSFADAYPYLLISEASLALLNEKLTEKGHPNISMKRFRPNLVVRGLGAPHAEDAWQQVQIGDAVFELPKLCSRCSVPAVDPQTGTRGKEPTPTLAKYRYWDKGIWFGKNCVQQGDRPEGGLQVGDRVNVLQTTAESPTD